MTPERIGEWIDRLGPGLVLFARQWCATPEDVVQEAFVALSRLADDPDDPPSWLHRVVRHGAINAGIAARRRRTREVAAGTDATRARWFEPAGAGGPATDRALDPDAAQVALAALPDDERAVIVAHLWGGLRFDQIAALLDTSTSTAHRRYQAGLIRLRARLGAPEPCRSTTKSPTPPTSNPTST